MFPRSSFRPFVFLPLFLFSFAMPSRRVFVPITNGFSGGGSVLSRMRALHNTLLSFKKKNKKPSVIFILYRTVRVRDNLTNQQIKYTEIILSTIKFKFHQSSTIGRRRISKCDSSNSPSILSIDDDADSNTSTITSTMTTMSRSRISKCDSPHVSSDAKSNDDINFDQEALSSAIELGLLPSGSYYYLCASLSGAHSEQTSSMTSSKRFGN